MAGWRQVVELAMSNEEVARLAAVSRSRCAPSGRAGWSGRKCCSPTRRIHRFLRLHEGSEAAITRRSNAASNERWPMAPWWRLTTDRDLAKSRQSRRRPRLAGLLGVRQGQGARVSARELWTTRLLARHAREHGPAAGHRCLARLVQGTVCKILNREETGPHKVRYLECRDAEFEQKMAEVSASIARSKSSSGRPPRKKPASRRRSSPTTKAGNPGHRHDLAGFAARAWRPPDLRT